MEMKTINASSKPKKVSKVYKKALTSSKKIKTYKGSFLKNIEKN